MSTETVDPRYVEIDLWPTALAVEAMLEGQLAAVAALKGQVGIIAGAADEAAHRLLRGGRLVYAGAGTSGRIAVLDGVELVPTYNWSPDRLVYLMAGGLGALTESAEGAEDDVAAGRREIAEAGVGPDDVVIGLAASGRTPYTVAAVTAAREAGALTLGVANNPGSALLAAAEYAVLAETGSELVAGSTRMKAGTAQKVALTLFSTTVMMRCGLVYRGMMIDMRISNEKLLKRGQDMVASIAGVDEAAAVRALAAAGNEIKLAVLLARGHEEAAAQALLGRCNGNLRAALAEVSA